MLWLRAYARKQRWNEEVTLVPFEMECTIRAFQKRVSDWEEWKGMSHAQQHRPDAAAIVTSPYYEVASIQSTDAVPTFAGLSITPSASSPTSSPYATAKTSA